MPALLHVFLDDTGAYLASPNRNVPPSIAPNPKFRDRMFELYETFTLQWASNRFPFLSFTPVSPDFTGPLFGRLAYQYKSFPVIQTNEGWCLDLALRERWFRLEECMYATAKHLLTNQGVMNSTFDVYPYPRSFGFAACHPTQGAARRAALKSRDAFVPLMALCSFAISYHIQPFDITNHRNPSAQSPSWARLLVDKCGAHPQWADNLQKSCVADFSIQRVGVLVNPYYWKYQNSIVPMLNCNVPVWIYWSKRKAPDPLVADTFRPTNDQFRAAVPCVHCKICRILHLSSFHEDEASGQENSSSDRVQSQPSHTELRLQQQSNDVSTVPAISPAAQLFPELPSGSRQRPGETCRQFLDRMEAKKGEIMERELPQARIRRLDRERAASKHIAPGHRGPTVFHWEKRPEHPGIRVRTLVPRTYVEGMFCGYGNGQRVYNGFLNEWDICTELDPGERPDDLSDDDESPLPPTGPPTSGTLQPLPQPNYQEVLATAYPRDVEEENDDELEWELFEDALGYWYGLVADITSPAMPSADVQKVRQVFGWSSDQVQLPRLWQQPAVALYRYLLGQGPAPIRDFEDMGDVIRESLIVATRIEIVGQDPIYLLRGKADKRTNPQWVIMVNHAASVLRALRISCGPRSPDIVKYLLDHGIAFNTLIPDPGNVPRLIPDKVYLGWRNAGYQPDQYEYVAYEERRDAFLKSPRGRAALLAGGILWRLSVGAVPENAVLSGPSPVAPAYGVNYPLPELGAFCDDKLTPDEEDLITGVYRVYTNVGTSQASLQSWWPRPSVWLRSGLHFVSWTPNDELWFQKRLKGIREGSLSIRSWNAGVIKLQKETPKVIAANERDAAGLLRTLLQNNTDPSFTFGYLTNTDL